MDDAAFDRIAAALGAAVSRRAGLIAAASAALAAAADRAGLASASAGSGRARPRPQGPCGDGSGKDNRCTADSDCCTNHCRKPGPGTRIGRCRCLRLGAACTADRNCCGELSCVKRVCAVQRPTPPPPPPPGPCDTPTVCASGCPRSTVQAAIDAATAGSTISIGPGTWTENLTISKNLTIIGCNATVRNTDTGEFRTIAITNSPTVELRDLTVDGTGGSSAVAFGGGISCACALTLSGSTIVTHGSADIGGCVDIAPASSLTMLDSSRIEYCYGSQVGGGVSLGDGATMTMSGTSSIANCASGGVAAGVMVSSATLTMSGSSSISSNSASNRGGGILLGPSSTFTITAPAAITSNTAGGLGGGGVYSDSAQNVATIAPNTVTGNSPNNCAGNGLSC